MTGTRRLHQPEHESPRRLWVCSRSLGMIGQTDVVEFHPDKRVTPVEDKRGKQKKDQSDRVQQCAQALCVEEMLNVSIASGELFYGQRKRRTTVDFDPSLRKLTIEKIKRLRDMIDNRETPQAIRMPKCENCSLVELCLPDSLRFKQGAAAWNQRQFAEIETLACPATDEFDFLE